jgi:hypothetical protein
MIWEREPLWAKAKLFFERAFAQPREDPLFGLWCSLGVELLARAAVASVSPTLLAEPDRDGRNLLHALNRPSGKSTPQSIAAVQVFGFCRILFDTFSQDDLTTALALVNRRNAELHSGAAAFEEYPATRWLPGFYRVCRALAAQLGESLETLFGAEEARVALGILEATQTEVTHRVRETIAAHRRVFEARGEEERTAASENAKRESDELAHARHHRAKCPACGSQATIKGEPFGTQRIEHEDDVVIVRQPVSPDSFECSACGLKLQGYAELAAADLGGQYTRRTEYTPEEFYGLIDPETADLTPYIESYLADMANEYDNE